MSLSQGSAPIGMSDKLYQLKNQGSRREPSGYSSLTSLSESEIGLPTYSDTENNIGDVLKTVDVLTEEINQIDQLIIQIANNHTAILSSHQNENAKAQNEKFHNEVKSLSHHIADELKRMKKVLDDEAAGSERHTANYRIRKAQHNTLVRQFRDTMMKVSEEEENYRDKNKDVLQRQLKITGQFQTEDKVEQILEQENPQLFVENILGRADQRMLNEVQTRHQEVLRLESNIRDLYDMFYDLAQLVYDQGELINQIEFNVERSSAYVDKGRQTARIAAGYQKKNNKLKIVICCVVSTVVIILILVIIIVIAAVGYFVFGR